MALIKASTSEELQAAIIDAKEGDKIELLPVPYYGNFIVPNFTGAQNPVIIYGTRNEQTNECTTILPPQESENSSAFQIDGDNWIIQSLVIKGFTTSVILNGRGNSLTSLVVENSQNGFAINGEKSTVKNCVISGNGIPGFAIDLKGDSCSIFNTMSKSTQEGIIISGQRPKLRNNLVTATRSLTVLEEVRHGEMTSNVFNGLASFSGSDFSITSNVANGGIIMAGADNRLRSNVLNQVRFVNNHFHNEGANVFNYA